MEGFKSFKKVQCFKEGGSVAYKSRKEMCGGGKAYKKGGEVCADDAKEDKKMIKKAFKQHDEAEHDKDNASEIKLKKGGRAKKEVGTVKKYKCGGGVYGAKKTDKDIKSIDDAKECKPKKLANGGQPGASAAQKKYYADNKAKAESAAAKKDYEVFGSRGDAARKGMEEGRMDAMGSAYKKGGAAKKYADGGTVMPGEAGTVLPSDTYATPTMKKGGLAKK